MRYLLIKVMPVAKLRMSYMPSYYYPNLTGWERCLEIAATVWLLPLCNLFE